MLVYLVVYMIPQHLATLIQAVKQIAPELVTNCRYVSEESQIIYLDERSFAYELYRQWQDLMENSINDLIINAEVAKKCVEEKEFIEKLEEIFGLTKEGKPHSCFFPDLVCHHSQFNSENQEVICEIKTKKRINDNTKLCQDFKKLAAYMTPEVLLCHPFSVGVFILIGGDFSDIKFKSEELIDKKKEEIYCLLYNVKRIVTNEEIIFIPNVQCKSLAEIKFNNKK